MSLLKYMLLRDAWLAFILRSIDGFKPRWTWLQDKHALQQTDFSSLVCSARPNKIKEKSLNKRVLMSESFDGDRTHAKYTSETL